MHNTCISCTTAVMHIFTDCARSGHICKTSVLHYMHVLCTSVLLKMHKRSTHSSLGSVFKIEYVVKFHEDPQLGHMFCASFSILKTDTKLEK